MMVSVWSGCGEEVRIHTENFSNGKVKEEYQYYNHPENNKRIKSGWYNSYYEDGEYKEVGTYREDKRVGEWTYFTEGGKETKGIWIDGKKDSGEFWINVKLKDGWYETEDETPNDEDVSKGLFTYKNGMWDGLSTFYWRNGN